MKQIYMIWEEDWGNTTIFFENEKDAKEYCELKNNEHDISYGAHYRYTIKQMTFYNSMEDYKTSKDKDYKKGLKSAIEGLKKSIQKIENNRYFFDVWFEHEYSISCSMEKFEEILNNFKTEYYTARQPSYETYIDYHWGKSRYITEEDLPIIKKRYKKAKQQLKDMQTTLRNYQKEYVELCGSKKEKKEEKELIK